MRPIFAALALLAFASSARPQTDWIHPKSAAQPIGGRIESETWRDVVLATEGGRIRLRRESIERIEYDSLPVGWAEAEALDRAGNFAGSAAAWRKVLSACASPSGRRLFEQHARWYLAVALNRDGRAADAAGELEALLQAFPDGLRLEEAGILRIETLLASGDPEGARTAAGQELARARAAGLPEAALLRLELAGAAAREADGDAHDAARAFAAVATKAARDPAIADRARLGQGRCLIAAGQRDEGRRVLQGVSETAQDAEVLAGAHVALADDHWSRFQTDSDRAALSAALFAYLRAVVLYLPEGPDGDGVRARALCGAGRCFETLRTALDAGRPRDTFKARACALYEECRDRHAGTPAAEEAARRLEGLK